MRNEYYRHAIKSNDGNAKRSAWTEPSADGIELIAVS